MTHFRPRISWLLSLLLAAALAPPAGADTTGKLDGTAVGPDGQPLPGVTITVESPALIGGSRIAVTGADGAYNFPALPPGVYTVRAELDGFVTQERQELEVRLDRTTRLDIEMPSATVTEEIVVSAETPVVDSEQVSISQTFSNDYLSNAAVGSTNRSYQNILGNAAGVVTSGGNPIVFGSTLGESAFLIDGIDTTDPVTSTFGTNFNYDAIEEISFMTAGFEAQYGRATGGVVNLITKSGGNDFSGTFDWRYAENGFNENGDHFDRDDNVTEFTNPTATLGGPIVRERAWFFGSGEWVDSRLTPTGSPTTRKFDGINYLGKATWQVNPSWQVVGKFSGEDSDIDNDDADRTIAAEATTFQEQTTDIVQADVSGILNQRNLWDFKAALYRAELNAFPQSGDLETPGHVDFFTGEVYVNAANAQFSERDRDEFATSYTYFAEGFGGSHELKVGIEYADLHFSSHNFTTANGLQFQDADRTPFVLAVSPDAGPVDSDGTLETLFVQDAWQPLDNLTLKLGVRYDQVAFDNNEGAEVADLDKLQPRVGVAWDIAGDGKNVARLAWGTFMHPNALSLPNFARTANSPFAFYLSCSAFVGDREFCESFGAGPPLEANGFLFPGFIDDPIGFDPLGWILDPGNLFGSSPSTIDPGLEPMYNEQIVVGFERELGPRTSVEISYIDKDTEDIFEDTCDGNLQSPADPAVCDSFIMANLPQLERDYRGGILRRREPRHRLAPPARFLRLFEVALDRRVHPERRLRLRPLPRALREPLRLRLRRPPPPRQGERLRRPAVGDAARLRRLLVLGARLQRDPGRHGGRLRARVRGAARQPARGRQLPGRRRAAQGVHLRRCADGAHRHGVQSARLRAADRVLRHGRRLWRGPAAPLGDRVPAAAQLRGGNPLRVLGREKTGGASRPRPFFNRPASRLVYAAGLKPKLASAGAPAATVTSAVCVPSDSCQASRV